VGSDEKIDVEVRNTAEKTKRSSNMREQRALVMVQIRCPRVSQVVANHRVRKGRRRQASASEVVDIVVNSVFPNGSYRRYEDIGSCLEPQSPQRANSSEKTSKCKLKGEVIARDLQVLYASHRVHNGLTLRRRQASES
jgi:hypothetical protein